MKKWILRLWIDIKFKCIHVGDGVLDVPFGIELIFDMLMSNVLLFEPPSGREGEHVVVEGALRGLGL